MMARFVVSFIASIFMTHAALAASLPIPTADYSADRVMEAKEGVMTHKINVSGLKQRAEMTMQGMTMVSILRPDKNVMWMIMPAMSMYQEVDLKKATNGRDVATLAQDPNVIITDMGKESAEGYDTTKYRMDTKDKSAEGFIWMTQDNIPVRMEMTGKDPSGKKSSVTVTLKNLKLGKQDPTLFELPSGLSKMPAMGGMGSGMPPMGGR